MNLSISVHNSFSRDWLPQNEWYKRMPHTLLTWSKKTPFVDLISSHHNMFPQFAHPHPLVPRSPKTFHLRSSCRWLWQWLLLQLPLFHNAQIHSLTERVTRPTGCNSSEVFVVLVDHNMPTGNSKKIWNFFWEQTRNYLGEFTNTISKKMHLL